MSVCESAIDGKASYMHFNDYFAMGEWVSVCESERESVVGEEEINRDRIAFGLVFTWPERPNYKCIKPIRTPFDGQLQNRWAVNYN